MVRDAAGAIKFARRGSLAAPRVSPAVVRHDFYVHGDLDGLHRARLANVRADSLVIPIGFGARRAGGTDIIVVADRRQRRRSLFAPHTNSHFTDFEWIAL